MKALLSIAPGGADGLVLSDVAGPAPKAGEVIVKVAACGLNYPDTLIIEDRYQMKPPRPFAPGCEVAAPFQPFFPPRPGVSCLPDPRPIGEDMTTIVLALHAPDQAAALEIAAAWPFVAGGVGFDNKAGR
ncbi:alcohol dehydrogenase catalytic domain-containing protein [Mesorhizobium australafricanum]|uniref:Alcohol dehydrogenase-like N-terminal domain-containing protein n=1 Tax=Mesorhizobium australafricanum TaxID=3072311 RepID=A0ABU4X4P8_9HYPH|nr:hypothetical protein [Mesorhizobium sp. VK3E]MDX8443312.1 hypothetical protein [Mesorhizobium sp. VK3E]